MSAPPAIILFINKSDRFVEPEYKVEADKVVEERVGVVSKFVNVAPLNVAYWEWEWTEGENNKLTSVEPE